MAAAERTIERLLAGRHDARLSDGRTQVSAVEYAERCAAIGRWLRDAGLEPDDVAHAELDSSVGGALALLALLMLGDSFVLTVAPSSLASPRMCRWKLGLRPECARAAIDPSQPGSFLALERLADATPPGLPRQRLLLRTSGSFGAPKLVVHDHAHVVANSANAIARLDLRADDRVLIPVPIGHMYGLGAALLPSLLVGADIELLPEANLLRYLERERSVRPTLGFLTPNLARTLMRPRSGPTSYRHVVVAGDKLATHEFTTLETIYGRVINLYGSTELGVICADDAGAPVDPTDESRAATVGRALPGVELELRAGELPSRPPAPELPSRPPPAELLSRPPPAELDLGELLCRHPFGFEGYVDEQGRTLDSPGTGGFSTRDLARIRPNGRVELRGRCDHAVKRDGRLVSLVEVEAALTQLDGVALAAAIVADESPRGRNIVCFCAPRPGATLSAAALRDACRDRLPAYALPEVIHVLAELPLLASGKLDRKALQAHFTAST